CSDHKHQVRCYVLRLYIFSAESLDQCAVLHYLNGVFLYANFLVVLATSHPVPLIVYLVTLADGLGCFPLDYESYHTQSDSQREVAGIRSLNELGNPMRVPRSISALPPVLTPFEASPKAISERTSYIRVRLAFHPYPHLIPAFFNIRGFGPPVSVT